MAKSITADEVVRKWQERGANSAATVRAGVQAVTESPMEKAAARKDAYLAGVQRAVASGKYEARLRAVSLQSWKDAMLGKGIQNMQTGYADAGNSRKFLAFMREFLPYVRQGAATVRAMPKGTLQQSIDRAAAMIRHNAAFRRAGGGAAGFDFNRLFSSPGG